MQKNYSFKKASVQDLKAFYRFFQESIQNQFPQYTLKTRAFFLKYQYSPEVFRSQIKSKEMVVYLAISSPEVVGYLVTGVVVGGVCLGMWIAVSAKHQGQGIGSKLLALWEKDAQARGIHKLHLWTEQRNIAFYQRRGFKLVGKIPENYYGVDDYLFYKSIQKPLEKIF